MKEPVVNYDISYKKGSPLLEGAASKRSGSNMAAPFNSV